MQDPNQQKPGPRTSTGFRALVPSDLTRNPGAPTVAYVGAAVGFGLAAGMAIALTMSSAQAHSTGHGSKPLSANGLRALPAVYTPSTPRLLDSVDPTRKPSASQTASGGPQILTLAADVPGQKPAGTHKKRHGHHLWNWKKRSSKGGVAKRAPYVSPNATEAVVEQPTGLERATAAAASGPFFLGIEGDVTVASYDVADGRIQTYEGNKFIVDRAAASGGAIRWQDFPFNVHYRCDGMGNCTLMRGGAAEIAKLTR